jgi:branched-subunit amino acid aminotransferase/4-amino-4-deoxychorismate lyase
MKTKRSNKNANVETLRVRYAELLRLREDVQRLEASCHTMEQRNVAPVWR